MRRVSPAYLLIMLLVTWVAMISTEPMGRHKMFKAWA